MNTIKNTKHSIHQLSILHQVLKKTKAYQIISSFIGFVLIAALIFMIVEPDINTYRDALWYSYVNLFTIGFGDIVPVTFIGRIVSVILTIYATIVIAVVTGVVVSFYTTIINKQFEKSKEYVLDALTRLPEMSKDELAKLSEDIKKLK